MQIFDAHCDTASELLNKGQSLDKNGLHIDVARLNRYKSFTQVFAAFIAPEYYGAPMERAEKIICNFLEEAKRNDITVCKSYGDWEQAKTKVKAFISLEGGEPIESISDLKKLYGMGVRLIAPTWNFRNRIACGVGEVEDTGLTSFGREVICEMDRLGIILDVSHLSEKSFWQAVECINRPVLASHSNLRGVKDNKRNLKDSQFLKLKETGGVCGINLYPPFLGDNIADVVSHIDRFLSLGGEDNIGLGCDFDGVDMLPEGVCGVQDLDKIIKSLPYSIEIKEKIAYKNFIRVIKSHNC